MLVLSIALAACVLPAAAHALTQSQITLDQESGGQPTRFTFEAFSDANAEVSSLSLTFPPGFDLKQSTVDAVTQIQALVRIPVKYTVSRVGQAITLTFSPPLTPSIDLQVKVNNVLTPARGGTYPFGVSYVANGITQVQTGMSFSFATPSGGEQVAHWFDQQPWVAKWNSVPFLNLFLQPQYAALAFTTVWVGWLISLALVALAFPLAIMGGLALAFMKMAKIAPVRWIASVYINVIRGTPLFLQIAIAFVGLPIAGFRFPWFPTGVIVLALNSSAYLAEIFRAGIQSINKGQFEAASSLGMTYPKAMQYVIIPQTVKRVLPTMTSVFYLIITIPLINYVGTLERKLAISEGGQVAETKKAARNRRAAADIVVDAVMPSATDQKQG